jgi:hypothetical protein
MCAVVDAQRAAPRRGMLARLVGLSPLTPAARASYRDALGELIVGDRLDGLGRHWDVLHDVRHPGGMIDHLVIGPTGVFTVCTLNADGADVVVDGETLRIGGVPSDAVRAARADARQTERLLAAALGSALPVSALIVLVHASRVTRRASAAEVRVVLAGELPRAIAGLETTVTGDVVARVSDVADRAETWDAGAPAGHTGGLHREFALVRESVHRATLARVLWGGVGFVVLCALAWGATAALVASAVTAG